jgi:hypothetical protein
MSKSLVLVIFLLPGFADIGAQELVSDDLEDGPTYTIDGDSYSLKNRGKKKIFINNRPVDSTGISFAQFLFLKNSRKVYGYAKSSDHKTINFYSIENGVLNKEITLAADFDILYDQILFSENIITKKNGKLFSLNTSSWEMIELLDIPKYTNGWMAEAIIFSQNGLKVLIEYGQDVGGGSDIYGFLLFDLKTKKVDDVTSRFEKILPIDPVTDLTVGLINQVRSNSHLFMENDHSVSGDLKDEFVFNNHFDLVGNSLAKTIFPSGLNIKKNRLISYNVQSRTENRKVILQYLPEYTLEEAFYKVYHDSLLSPRELNLDKLQLELARNFIFAKHNYKFDNEYYQAYFNLFEFYNAEEKRLSRTKEVNHLLTEADKKNLALLTRALSK